MSNVAVFNQGLEQLDPGIQSRVQKYVRYGGRLVDYLIWEVVADESANFQLNLQELRDYMPFYCNEVLTATLSLNALGFPDGYFMCIFRSPDCRLFVVWCDLYAKPGQQGVSWKVLL